MSDFVTGLETFADDLRALGTGAPTLAAQALKAGAEKAEQTAIQKIHATVNLDRGYIAGNIEIALQPSATRLEARVRARRRKTTHRSYGAQYVTVPAATQGKRKKYLRGRTLGGIPPGQKADGFGGYKVWRNGRDERWNRGFFIEGKNGNILSVRRTGPGRDDYKTIYGMSVYQTFTYVLDDVREEAVAEVMRVISEGI